MPLPGQNDDDIRCGTFVRYSPSSSRDGRLGRGTDEHGVVWRAHQRIRHTSRVLENGPLLRSIGTQRLLGGPMNLSPAFGIMGILYAVFTIAVAVLAVYALVLAIIFLRLRIAELKRTARSEDG